VFPSRRRASMADLVGRAHRFCVCGAAWTDIGHQRSPGTRDRLLVCLSQAGSTHQQALSRTHGQGDTRPLRGGGAGPLKRAIASLSGVLTDTARGRSRVSWDFAQGRTRDDTALNQALSPTSAYLAGGAGPLAF